MVRNVERKYKLTLKNTIKHFNTINKHRWLVFKLCCKAGIPWRGFVHDLSTQSRTEYWDSVRYYQGGKKSPIPIQKEIEGFSKVWLHHRARNKHHSAYWYDNKAPVKTPIIPYKYTVEMICDKLSASIVYTGKDWTNETELNYWRDKEREVEPINENIKKVFDEVFLQVSKEGIKRTITSKNLKKIYNKYCKANE